jgi:peroxiredoxin
VRKDGREPASFVTMSARYWIVLAIAGIIIIVMSAYHYWVRPNKGDIAPSFVLQDIANEQISLSDYRGKVILLHFWSTWCHTCQAELPLIEKLNREYETKGLKVLSILVDERHPQKGVNEMKKIVPFDFSVLIDPKGQVADAYEVWGVPESFIIDRDGTILKRFSRAVSEEEIRSFLNGLL